MPPRRNFGGGGGFRSTMSLGLPPFYGAVKWLVIVNSAIYLLMLVVQGVAPGVARGIYALGYLTPTAVMHGWIWQLVSYSFFHLGLFHILFNMITLWMFGALLEQGGWRSNQFYEFYFTCVVGAAVTTIAVSYLGLVAPFTWLGVTPLTATAGSSGGIYGIMIAVAVLYGDSEFMMFPLPITIRAKYLVAIFVFISLAGALQGGRGESVANFAHLGGALVGYLYLKLLPRGGLMFATSERYYGVRNSYYRWKRRRAAKKFEVYMRKHDRSEFFDEYGNYRDPKDKEKGNGGSSNSNWVN
ncbi:MAG TPA: rhomboid family intramembrane serine protease [Terriglobales bacterium]|nr:rhomboid family intramembrane serine protease [Terriglobales bacterium]